MRGDMVENGLKFLEHPNVQSTPLSERVSFLEGKGMTKEEIQEAIERHQNKESPVSPVAPKQEDMQPQNLPSMMMPNAAPMHMMQHRGQYPAFVRILWTVSSLVGAVSILTLLWNYAVQSGYIPWLRPMAPLLEAAKVQEEKEQEAKKDETLLAELSSMSSAIQRQTDELAKLSLSLDGKECDLQTNKRLSTQISSSLAEQSNAQSIAELKAEVSTIKALLVLKSTDSVRVEENNEKTKIGSSKTTEVTTTFVNSQQPQHVVPQAVYKAERMITALKKLRTENSIEQLKLAADLLIMYVTNLIENPDVPRYRRIAPGNANFRQKMEPLKHHKELLESIGFESVGLNMEWKWHTADKTTGAFDDNIAILRALLKALKSLTYPKSPSTNVSLEEIARKSLDKFVARQDKREPGTSTIQENLEVEQSSDAMFDAPSASNSTSLDAFMARLEVQTNGTNIAHGDKIVNKTLSSFAHDVKRADEDKMPVHANSSSSSTAWECQPSYPESFDDVMSLIQKGEPVPGIRDIETKLSVDTSELLRDQLKAGEAVTKPWEKTNT